jgi:adenine deaminase
VPIASWPESAPDLIDVAAGRKPADLVVRNGQWVNVHSGESIGGMDVAIIAGRFAAIATDLSDAIGPQTQLIDAAGR